RNAIKLGARHVKIAPFESHVPAIPQSSRRGSSLTHLDGRRSCSSPSFVGTTINTGVSHPMGGYRCVAVETTGGGSHRSGSIPESDFAPQLGTHKTRSRWRAALIEWAVLDAQSKQGLQQ